MYLIDHNGDAIWITGMHIRVCEAFYHQKHECEVQVIAPVATYDGELNTATANAITLHTGTRQECEDVRDWIIGYLEKHTTLIAMPEFPSTLKSEPEPEPPRHIMIGPDYDDEAIGEHFSQYPFLY